MTKSRRTSLQLMIDGDSLIKLHQRICKRLLRIFEDDDTEITASLIKEAREFLKDNDITRDTVSLIVAREAEHEPAWMPFPVHESDNNFPVKPPF